MEPIATESAAATVAAPVVEDATPSAPLSTADIAAHVDKSLNEAPERPIEPTRQPTETPKPAAEPELSAAAKFLLKQGHRAKKDDGRDVWLPVKTVEGMLDRYADEHKTAWGGERTVIETERNELRAYQHGIRQAFAGDARAFLESLAAEDPRYKAFLEPSAAAQPKPTSGDMPQPDAPLPDGSRTYSVEGIQKLIEWAVDARMMPKVDERLKPWAERDKAERARAEQETATAQSRERTRSQIVEAESWPGFGKLAADGSLSEFQQQVLAELTKDSEAAKAANRRPTKTMREAYLEVHARALAADDTARRARWIEEQNSAPRSTSVTRQGTEAVRRPGPRTTADIAREVVERGA